MSAIRSKSQHLPIESNRSCFEKKIECKTTLKLTKKTQIEEIRRSSRAEVSA